MGHCQMVNRRIFSGRDVVVALRSGSTSGKTNMIKNRWATVVVRLRLSLSPAEYVVELCLVAVGGHLRSACTFVKLIPMNQLKELVLWSRVVLGRVWPPPAECMCRY